MTDKTTDAPTNTPTETTEQQHWRAAAEWYHATFTGLVLSAVARRGAGDAAEYVEAIFTRQRRATFLGGLEKLGLAELPHAVAAAQYHYLSNHIGGVAVEYLPETDRKAWIRYVPPRWVWEGTALCGIPGSVSTAMLRGWHAQNGVSLGNPRLGFVCTKQTADGDNALEGYYYEYDEPLAPPDRLRFARDEDGPDVDPSALPELPTATWPATRLAKAHRNYAMQYVQTALPTAVDLWGPADGGHFLRLTGKLIGMQHFHQSAEAFGITDLDSAAGFLDFWAALHIAQGADVRRDGSAVVVGSGLLAKQKHHPAAELATVGMAEGSLAAADRRATLTVSTVDGAMRYEVQRVTS